MKNNLLWKRIFGLFMVVTLLSGACNFLELSRKADATPTAEDTAEVTVGPEKTESPTL